MRAGASLLALLCVTGCTVEWVAQPASPGVTAWLDAPAAQGPVAGQLGALEQALLERLQAVEQQLEGAADLDEARASELREERLLLTVALRELAAWVEAGAEAWGEHAPELDVDSWLALVRRRLAEGRQRVADRRLQTRGGYFDFGRAGGAAAGDYGGEGRGNFETGIDYKPVTEIPFGDDVVDGALAAPGPSPQPEQPKEESAEEEEQDEDEDGWAASGEDDPDASAPAAAAVVADQEPPLDLMPAVRRRTGLLRGCFSPADLDSAIHLEVMARLAGDGSLRILRVSADRALAPATSSCVSEVLAAVRVEPAAHRASRVVTFPFTLAKD